MANLLTWTSVKSFCLCLVLYSIHEGRHYLALGQTILSQNFAIRNSVCSMPGAIVDETNLLLTVLVYTFRVDMSLPWTFTTNLSTASGIHTVFASAQSTKCNGIILVNNIRQAKDYPVACSRDETYLYIYVNRIASVGLTDQLLMHTFRSARGEDTSPEFVIPTVLAAGNETLMVNWEIVDVATQWILFEPDLENNITYCVTFSGKTHMQIGFNKTIDHAMSNCITRVVSPSIESVGMALFVRADEESGPCRRTYIRRYVMTMDLFDSED